MCNPGRFRWLQEGSFYIFLPFFLGIKSQVFRIIRGPSTRSLPMRPPRDFWPKWPLSFSHLFLILFFHSYFFPNSYRLAAASADSGRSAHARSRARCQLLFSPGLFLTRPFPWILLLSSFLCIDINIYLQVSVGDCYSFSGTWILRRRRRRREPLFLSLSFSLLVRALSVCVCVYRNVTP